MYELLQHTADIRMRVRASSREELFAEALRGLMAIADPQGVTDDAVQADVHVEAHDTTALLVDFLNEALTRSHVHRETYGNVVFHELTDVSLRAALSGFRVVSFGEDVKAVTLHDAEVRHDGDTWSTELVLDI
jgi:SHS2 domain-containing protein